jgi:hypothetical protein
MAVLHSFSLVWEWEPVFQYRANPDPGTRKQDSDLKLLPILPAPIKFLETSVLFYGFGLPVSLTQRKPVTE